MPKKARASMVEVDHEKNIATETLTADHLASGELAVRLAEIDRRFGDGTPYDRLRLVHEIKFYLDTSVESMLEAGRRLLVLKEHEEQGAWLKALDQLGVAPRSAQKLMQAAVKFENSKLAPLLNLPRGHLLELLTVDDDQLEALAEGGTIAGVQLDQLSSMTWTQLREGWLREVKAHVDDNEANEKLIERKDKKLNELAKKTVLPWDARMAGLIDELHTCSLASSECLTRVYQVAEAAAVAKLENDDGLHQHQELAARLINDVNLLVNKVAAIQAFAYENFLKYCEGGTPVLGDAVEPARGKKR